MALTSRAQTIFFKTYGSTNKEEGKTLAQCSDGGFIIGADVTLIPPAPDSSNILIIRTNSSGDTLWTRIINSGENDFCVKVIETSDLGFAVLANRVSSANNSKIILIKLDALGVVQWNKTFLNNIYGLTGYSFIEKMQGGYLICGGKTNVDGLLINTNTLGDTLWTKYYAYGSMSFKMPFHDVKQLSDSTFVILCAHYNINVFDPILLRINANGNLMYDKDYSYSLDDGLTATFADMLEENHFVIGGAGTGSFSGRVIIKADSLFNVEWVQNYTPYSHVISNIVETQDSGFVFMRGLYGSSNSHNCYMVKTNSSGIVSWSKEFQYTSLRSPHSLVLTSDNGIAFCGFFMDTISSNNKDLVLIKTDANGNIPCDGISANIVNSSITFFQSNNTYSITGGVLINPSTLTTQGGIQTSNLCFATTENDNRSDIYNELGIYPSPADESVTVAIDSQSRIDKKITLQVIDISGRILSEERITANKIALNISNLANGIYLCRILTDDKKVSTVGKLVVVH